jgi:hypothetical protein
MAVLIVGDNGRGALFDFSLGFDKELTSNNKKHFNPKSLPNWELKRFEHVPW